MSNISTAVVPVRASNLEGRVPVAAWAEYDFSYGNKLYLYPSSFLSEGDLYGYILEIIGFDSSTVVIGMNIDILAFGNPKPLLAVTLPTITP